MPRVDSLYLPNLSTDRVRASEGRRKAPIPLPEGESVGRGGSASAMDRGGRAPSPSPPRGAGERGREACPCPNTPHGRPRTKWALRASPSPDGEGGQANPGGGVIEHGPVMSPLHHPAGGPPPHAAHGEAPPPLLLSRRVGNRLLVSAASPEARAF